MKSIKVIILLINLTVIKSTNMTEIAHEIETILNKCSNRRIPKCIKSVKLESLVENTLKLIEESKGFGDFLNSFNVSRCAGDNSSEYITNHILNGLIIHDDLPVTHWYEYKSVHNKLYQTPQQELIAMAKWRNNLELVAQHNRDFLEGKQSYSLHLNRFGDLDVNDIITNFLNVQKCYIGESVLKNCTYCKWEIYKNELAKTLFNDCEYDFYALERIFDRKILEIGIKKHRNIPKLTEICKCIDNKGYVMTKDVKEYFSKFLKFFHTFPLFDPAEDHYKTSFRKNTHQTIPKSFDWRTKGFRPRHEEQHHCGACYAFAVTHAMQAQLYKRHGSWGELSPQQIVDCSLKDGNAGCDGGSLRAALRYAARDGLIKESQYPYTGKDGHCQYSMFHTRVRARSWATLPAHDEAAMEKALVTIGPLAVALNAAPFTFQLYKSGIYDDWFCTPWQMNHAMLLVGYTPDYWILLNWWGKNWGEDGYIRIRRGYNRCGVSNMATYVEI